MSAVLANEAFRLREQIKNDKLFYGLLIPLCLAVFFILTRTEFVEELFRVDWWPLIWRCLGSFYFTWLVLKRPAALGRLIALGAGIIIFVDAGFFFFAERILAGRADPSGSLGYAVMPIFYLWESSKVVLVWWAATIIEELRGKRIGLIILLVAWLLARVWLGKVMVEGITERTITKRTDAKKTELTQMKKEIQEGQLRDPAIILEKCERLGKDIYAPCDYSAIAAITKEPSICTATIQEDSNQDLLGGRLGPRSKCILSALSSRIEKEKFCLEEIDIKVRQKCLDSIVSSEKPRQVYFD